MISSAFGAVLDLGMDTMFVCFCEDVEHNDGSEENPYFMAKKFRKFVGKKKEITQVNQPKSQKTSTMV